ncbi:AraC family transcriptional regulator [Phyllobacterium sp. SB3]|uniref:AraC family transcriptional regulator n=1 Tax=Phyllobacterium sp. SB3 TaxID=3156073 RepID=UPI0032AF4CF6
MLDLSSNPGVNPIVDPLTSMLRGLSLDGVEYGRALLPAPWAFSFPVQDDAYFHFISGRPCWLRTAKGEWLELAAGDAVLLPRGDAHALASAPDAVSPPFPIWKCDSIWGEGGEVSEDKQESVLFHGSMRFNLDRHHPLLRMMPDTMHAKAMMKNEAATLPLLHAMASEIALNRVGACGIVARLADVLAAQIIRGWIENGCGGDTGWIAAVRHPEIGHVLATIHSDLEANWTVESLAALMGASRSSFAAKFAAVVGTTPARYLAHLRMCQARHWIISDSARISAIATRLGYDSEASFSRSFKRVLGFPPSHYRPKPPLRP